MSKANYLPYTGVGSRSTPQYYLSLMKRIASRLATLGFILRSGAADGADSAFEDGHIAVTSDVEIYLPWNGFNNSTTGRVISGAMQQKATEIVSNTHPYWNKLSLPAQKLHTRNCFQVLGATLNNPSEFLVCFTPDGCTGSSNRTKLSGGTATAIVLAEKYNVPVFNLQNKDALNDMANLLKNKYGKSNA